VKILRDLRRGEYDVLIGVNLLREGLDLPEVSLVAILDADKEGFLRDARSLIQTVGRAARNERGKAIMYADRVTRSMAHCIEETDRRREVQRAYNEEHGITPETIHKSVDELLMATRVADARGLAASAKAVKEDRPSYSDEVNLEEWAKILEAQMKEAAERTDFERAATLRDELFEVRALLGASEVSGGKASGGPSGGAVSGDTP
jgi:excinuclease ABC subunit B